MELEPFVAIRGRAVACVDGGMLGCEWTERLALLDRRFESEDLLSDNLGLWLLLAFDPGLFARFDVSLIQFLKVRRWFMKGCFARRLGTKPFGDSRSELDTT